MSQIDKNKITQTTQINNTELTLKRDLILNWFYVDLSK